MNTNGTAGPYGLRPSEEGISVKGFLKGLGAIVVVLLVIIAVEVGGLHSSLAALREQASTAQLAMDRMQLHLDTTNVAELYQDTVQVSTVLSRVDNELSTWPWDVARLVPVVGEDVDTARDLVSILKDFFTKSMPALKSLEGVAQDASNMGEVIETAGGVPGLVDQAQALTDAVTYAKQRIQDLPEAHVPELRDLVSTVGDKLAQVDEELGASRTALSLVDGAVNFVTGGGK